MTATESIENIINFLNGNNIKTFYNDEVPGKFNRTLSFEVDGFEYFIVWWKNQCYLKLINDFSVPNLPFKYIEINPYSPTTKHEFQLCFFDEYLELGCIPFGAFKIPFNK